MYPSYSKIQNASHSKQTEEDEAMVSLCPLGCLCCIMQQFYNRRCWCKEVKESTGTQTDPDLTGVSHNKNIKVTVDIAIQTETVDIRPNVTSVTCNREPIPYMKQTLGQRRTKVGWAKRRQMQEFFKTGGPKNVMQLPSRSETPNGATETTSPVPMILAGPFTSSSSSILQTALAQMASNTLAATHAELRKYSSHGTVEHGKLQTTVNEIMDRYDLSGAKDPQFEEAFNEVLDRFPVLKNSDQSKHMVRSKLRHRISSKRHYTRMKSEASSIGIAVSALKKQRVEENAIQHKLLGETIIRESIGITVPTHNGDRCQYLPSTTCATFRPSTSNIPVIGQVKSDVALSQDVTHSIENSDNQIDERNRITDDSSNEALDLSDPRHDVIIKIEPPDT